jgi:hypothetical protein
MRRVYRVTLLVLLLASWGAAGQVAPATDEQTVFGKVDGILGELSRISGIPVRRSVASGFISRGKVNEFLKRRVKETATPGEIRAEELTLKAFGLVPPDFDLARSTVDLLTEQAAAFYDFHKRRLFITDAAPSETYETALVHELAHALADQSFNLDRFIKQGGKSDDGSLARMAVMEGQATWLMCEYLARQKGQSLETSPALAEAMSRSAESVTGQFPVFTGAPLYMRATLMFPYSKGMQFQQAVVEKDGQAAFAEVFRHAPASTQQVLHPAKYFAGVEPAAPALPLFHMHGYKELTDGSFGELDHAILIEQYAGAEEASEAAPHWRGGHYRVYEKRGRPGVVLAYASEWDTPESAQVFFRLYRRVLAGKWKRFEIASETALSLSGRGDTGCFLLERRGTLVTSLEGAEAPGCPAVH